MTSQELFDKYANWMIEHKAAGEKYRLVGCYNVGTDLVLTENDDPQQGNNVHTFAVYKSRNGWNLVPGLSDESKGTQYYLSELNLDNIEPPRTPGPNLCCRCGNRYANRKEHKSQCKRDFK